jgi:dynein heavy chain
MTSRVHRVLSMERGHLILAGLPSVGRKTVARLAAFVEQMIIQRLEVTKNFGVA